VLRLARRFDAPGAAALTFDDGPHAEGTPAVLEALAPSATPATFFMVGEQVERMPALAAEVAAAGHRVGVHGYRHRNQLRLSPMAAQQDLQRAVQVISEAVGRPPHLYRPAYGIFSPAGLAQVRRRGLTPLLWSRWGRDWRAGRAPGSIAREVTRDLTAGDVLLLHDADHYSAPGCWRATVAALPEVLGELERNGLRGVAL
jgi:peptidoglycan/xylan/chitin deacetylase (PgdA/CDA1 family)